MSGEKESGDIQLGGQTYIVIGSIEFYVIIVFTNTLSLLIHFTTA